MPNKYIHLTIIAAIILIVLGVFYANIPKYCGIQLFGKSFANRSKLPAGFGGGVIIIDGHKKQFVTMVQKLMIDLDAHGFIPMKAETKRVWIDVGSHAESFLAPDPTYSMNYWPNRTSKSVRDDFRESNDVYAIAIDPNANFYDNLFKIPRLTPIIAAIYTVEGTQLFREYIVDGCSSLLEPNVNLDQVYLVNNELLSGCHNVKRMTGVSTVRLETILSIIDPRLDIQLLKIDAQGVDLEVVKSCGSQLRRVEKIIIETQKRVSNNKTNNMLYKNQMSAEDSVKWMDENGFTFNEKQSFVNNKMIEEYNYVFDNRDVKKKI